MEEVADATGKVSGHFILKVLCSTGTNKGKLKEVTPSNKWVEENIRPEVLSKVMTVSNEFWAYLKFNLGKNQFGDMKTGHKMDGFADLEEDGLDRRWEGEVTIKTSNLEEDGLVKTSRRTETTVLIQNQITKLKYVPKHMIP